MRILLVVVACALTVAGCSRDDLRTNIFRSEPAAVPASSYMAYSCPDLADEAKRVSEDAVVASGGEDYSGDQVAADVGRVVFFPVLIFSKGNYPNYTELRRLNATMAAIEQASAEKNCGIVFKHVPRAPPAPPPSEGPVFRRHS